MLNNKKTKFSRLSKIYPQVRYFRYGLLLLCCIYPRLMQKWTKPTLATASYMNPTRCRCTTVHSLFTGGICCQQCLENNNRGNDHIQRVFSSQIHLVPICIFAQNPNITFFASGKQRIPMACKHLLYPKGKNQLAFTLGRSKHISLQIFSTRWFSQPPFCLQCTGAPLCYANESSFWPLICIFHSSHF